MGLIKICIELSMYGSKVFTQLIKICMGPSKVCIRLSKVCMGLNNINVSTFCWASDKTSFDGVRYFDRLLSCLTD